jgi:ABC-type transporter Mla MlaB component
MNPSSLAGHIERMTTLAFFGAPLERDDLAALCDRVRALLEEADPGPVTCDVGRLGSPDAVTLEALARIQLAARRLGHALELRHACGELLGLLALTGLGDALGLEVVGEPEQREQVRRVEEEADPGDRSA